MIREHTGEMLSEILNLTAEDLDVPVEVDDALTAEYEHLTTWLRDECEDRLRTPSEIYPQGSRRLGTMVRPVVVDVDYDVDLVFRRVIARGSTTQKELKERIGSLLQLYVATVPARRRPTLKAGSRCWRLEYPTSIHLDVLPAIPNDHEGQPGDSILITDRRVGAWLVSDPKGLAQWFDEQQRLVLLDERSRLAKSRGVTVEQIPAHAVRTPLQRVVQLLKRHRDIAFEHDLERRPASIIITVLAALAYQDERDPYAVIRALPGRAKDLLENRGGVHWIPNPVCLKENFADRWKEHPDRAAAFFAWLDKIDRDVATIAEQRGFDRVAKSLDSVFGAGVGQRVVTKYGESVRKQRESGALRATSRTGALGGVGSIVPAHTFYGGPRPR